jgi:hypothetical protein
LGNPSERIAVMLRQTLFALTRLLLFSRSASRKRATRIPEPVEGHSRSGDGRAAADTWLRTSLDCVGHASSFEIAGLLEEVLTPQMEAPPVAPVGPTLPLPEIAPAKGFG